jgi:16S rRNA processing protein RimM
MFSLSNSVEIGTIIRLHGTDGALISTLDIPEVGDNFKKTESVFIKKDGLLIPFFVEFYKLTNKNIILKLRCIDSVKYAERFLNCKVLTTIDIMSEIDGDTPNQGLHAYQVFDVNFGHIGIVKNINQIPGNFILEVDYKEKTILIPIADEIIKDINHKECIIYVETPRGLIELYI